MWEVLQIDKTLRIIEDKLINNNTKLTEIDRHIKNDSEKLKDDPIYSKEQR